MQERGAGTGEALHKRHSSGEGWCFVAASCVAILVQVVLRWGCAV